MSKRVLTLDWTPFLPHQYEFFNFRPTNPQDTEVGALLGGWGSGKTVGLVRKAFLLACQNPWTPAYGDDCPTGIIEAPTFSVLKISIIPLIKRLWPRQAILRWHKSPPEAIQLVNGFKYYLFSSEGAMEGASLATYVITEISHPNHASDPQRYLNKLARLRDPLAKRRAMIVDGLPESGFVRDTFGEPVPGRHCTILAGTKANPHLPPSMMQTFLEACPDGQQASLIGGQWMAPQGAVYSQFDHGRHVTEAWNPDPRQPVHLGIDPGNQTAVVVGQEIPVVKRDILGKQTGDKGLLIVDNLVMGDSSVDAALYEFKLKTPWQVVPGISTISIDPKAMKEVKVAIRNHFPGVKVIQRDRGDSLEPVESGIRVVQAALRDALGNTRLFFHKSVAKTKFGAVEFMTRYRRNAKTEMPIKDNSRDHAGDALRYLVCSTLGPPPVPFEIRGQRG